jgi:hypothetical protein
MNPIVKILMIVNHQMIVIQIKVVKVVKVIAIVTKVTVQNLPLNQKMKMKIHLQNSILKIQVRH